MLFSYIFGVVTEPLYTVTVACVPATFCVVTDLITIVVTNPIIWTITIAIRSCWSREERTSVSFKNPLPCTFVFFQVFYGVANSSSHIKNRFISQLVARDMRPITIEKSVSSIVKSITSITLPQILFLDYASVHNKLIPNQL